MIGEESTCRSDNFYYGLLKRLHSNRTTNLKSKHLKRYIESKCLDISCGESEFDAVTYIRTQECRSKAGPCCYPPTSVMS